VLAQARPKALDESLGRRTVAQEPDPVHLPRLLRGGGERRGEKTGYCPEERASVHS
jgi:hypothetical protein